MKKKLIVLFLLIIIPFSTLALSDNYVDKVADRVKQAIYKETTYRNVNAINFLK